MRVQTLEADGVEFESLVPPPATCVTLSELCNLGASVSSSGKWRNSSLPKGVVRIK